MDKPFEYKKSLNLDQEKSKLSLAEVYEKEYIKQTEVLSVLQHYNTVRPFIELHRDYKELKVSLE